MRLNMNSDLYFRKTSWLQEQEPKENKTISNQLKTPTDKETFTARFKVPREYGNFVDILKKTKLCTVMVTR